jgi:formate dehydrogenase assembly factor FdhD
MAATSTTNNNNNNDAEEILANPTSITHRKALLAATQSTHTCETAETPKPQLQTCAAHNNSSKAIGHACLGDANPTTASKWRSCPVSMQPSANTERLLS